MADFTICLPHLHTPTDIRALRVALDTIVRHTRHDYELLLDAHDGGSGIFTSFNRLACMATTDWLVFTASDQFVSPDWDEALWDARADDRLVIGGLVESGFMLVAEQNLERNFGMSPETYDERGFNAYAAQRPALPRMEAWVMPWLIHRQAFLDMGGFVQSTVADIVFFQRWQQAGKHWTRAESYSYHLMVWTSTGATR